MLNSEKAKKPPKRMSSSMKLAELRAAAKAAGVPSSGNKKMLMQRLQPASPTVSSAQSGARGSKAPANVTNATRLPVKLDDAVLKSMKLRLTGVGTTASGQPEYIYMPIQSGTSASSGAAAKTITKGAKTSPANKKQAAKKKCDSEVSDEALDEAIGCFVERLDEKKVPVELCRQMLKHFVDEKDIPKQKTKVYELLAEQSHLETDDEGDDDE